MSNVTPQQSKKDGLPTKPPPAAHPHPTSSEFSKYDDLLPTIYHDDSMVSWLKSTFVSTPPAPDLTPYITKISNLYVAAGGFGDVYKCRYLDGSTPQDVAVKALRFAPDEDTKKKYDKMVRRELGVWKRLRHNNIVPFLGIAYGFGMDGAMSLVSLWMSNETLPKFLKTHDNKLDVVHRLQILFDVAKGLDYLHSFPIVHGDLNSNNVLLDADYTARLADFGYASLVGNIPEALCYLQRSTDRPGALRWIAPEQIDFEKTFNRTTKSDIYSFGCIALEVLSGKQPWSEVSEDLAVILRLHLGHKPDRPESRMIDDSHWDFIQRCWSPLHQRPATNVIILSIQRFLSDYTPSGPLRDLFISPSSRAQDSLSDLSLGLTATRPLEATVSPLNPPNPPPAQDRNSRLIDLAVSATNSSALRARHKIQNGSMDGPGAVPMVFKLRVLATDLWNKIKRESSAPTMDISENDIVVFVVGPTGSGKSWFTSVATNCSLVKVNRDLCFPITCSVQAIRCELADEAKRDLQEVRNIVFVDTPSFLTGYDHPDSHKEFKAWFNKIVYKPRHVGVIYMHRVETDPALEPIRAHLQEFSDIRWISDSSRPQRLLVVVSYDKTSGVISESKINQRTSDLHNQVNSLRQSTGRWQPSSIYQERFQGEPEVAWRAVEALFRNL